MIVLNLDFMRLIDYGVAIFAIGGMIYFGMLLSRKDNGSQILEVIQNNTKTFQGLELLLVKQETMLKEVLVRLRSEGGVDYNETRRKKMDG